VTVRSKGLLWKWCSLPREERAPVHLVVHAPSGPEPDHIRWLLRISIFSWVWAGAPATAGWLKLAESQKSAGSPARAMARTSVACRSILIIELLIIELASFLLSSVSMGTGWDADDADLPLILSEAAICKARTPQLVGGLPDGPQQVGESARMEPRSYLSNHG